jgi:hypothetical protein
MRWFRRAAILFAFAGVDISAAIAQETPVWTDIDCSQSQLVTPPGLKCRSTQIYAGSTSAISGAGGGGQRRQWVSFGVVSNSKIYAHCLDEIGSKSYAVTSALESTIKNLSPYAKNARDFSPPAQLNGTDYTTFTSEAGERCVAVRRLGPVQGRGYKWIVEASKCLSVGKALSQDDIGQFIAQVNFRG